MVRKPLQRPAGYDMRGHFKAAHYGLPEYLVHSPSSLYPFDASADVVRHLGLVAKPKGRVVLTPEKAPLQWGWATDNRRQIAFEIGTSKTLVSLHFRKVAPATGITPWHLDTTEIDMNHKDSLGRSVTFHMPCDEEQYRGDTSNLFNVVRGAMNLIQKGDAEGARDTLDDLVEPIVRRLDVLSEMMATDHEVEFLSNTGQFDPGRLRL